MSLPQRSLRAAVAEISTARPPVAHVSVARLSLVCLAVGCFALALSAAPSPSHAAKRVQCKKTERILVIGDSLAGSLWIGLYRAYRHDRCIKVVNKSKISTGIVRDDYYNWNRHGERLARAKRAKTVVIMVGGNDYQPIRVKGKRYRERLGTPLWQKTYSARVKRLIESFTSRGARVFWVGMPIQRKKADDRIGVIINRIVAEHAKANDRAHYVHVYDMFKDRRGRYADHLVDPRSGKRRRMRDKDGMHFTTRGVLWLGAVVAKRLEAPAVIAKAKASEQAAKTVSP
ncbi:MAG: DUF459 domain-containing protein [Pseudomonadota bacterium]